MHSSVASDLAVTSLLGPLVAGGSVVLIPQGKQFGGLATELQGIERFGLVKLTPTHFDLLRPDLEERGSRPGEAVVFGGEALHYESFERWHQRAPGCRLINEYGPTEAVVGWSLRSKSMPRPTLLLRA